MENISLFHITHIDNLSKIIEHGVLYCKNKLIRLGISHSTIAYEGLQDRRSHNYVPCGPGGVLHDYVPFFFGPRPPMLLAICKGYVESFHGEQDEIIYLEIELSDVISEDLPFVFTDGHAIMFFSNYYEDPEKIEEVIDWEVMRATYWRDTLEDGDRKRRRQAEFLIHEEVPFTLIKKITTMTRKRMEQVLSVMQEHDSEIIIESKLEWYY